MEVKLAQLYRSFDYPSGPARVRQYLPKRLIRDYPHWMCLKVWLQLPGSNDNGIYQFLHQGVSCFGPPHDQADIIHHPINFFLLPDENTTECRLGDCQIEL
ncbi:hypothetical protein LIER_35949 [Lithospermum erythrorhizon]|uniref:Uncharacterized protein n=1 Tax=Lithospermum erythrorhizon TaxID=34254 RepID=A0AAV3NYK2_LITER